jgi:O-antigen/teichoic acid export membrane protein
VPQQRLARALRHREIAAANASATLLSALLRVILALNGYGAWAFVVAHTVYSLLLLLALWILAPQRPRALLDRTHLRDLLGLGMPSALSHALSQWARNIDYLFVGAFLGVVPLGLYRVAFDLAMEPAIAMGDVIARSAAPTLRKLASSREQLKGAFAYAIKLSLGIAVPLAVATFYFAPQLLELIKDTSYVEASTATRWLAVAAVLRVLLGLYTPLAVAIGKPGLALRANLDQFALLSFALLLCVGALGSSLSIASAGVAWCAALTLTLVITRARFRNVLSGGCHA